MSRQAAPANVTGGRGYTFADKVAASFLTSMLCRGFPLGPEVQRRLHRMRAIYAQDVTSPSKQQYASLAYANCVAALASFLDEVLQCPFHQFAP
jgi:hypothetical protein